MEGDGEMWVEMWMEMWMEMWRSERCGGDVEIDTDTRCRDRRSVEVQDP